MKILIAAGIYPPDIGGPATYSKFLVDELPKKGIETEVLSFGSVRHLPKFFRHFFYFLKVLRSGRRADIIFAQDPASAGLPAALASFILRKKFVLRAGGDFAWEQGSQKFGVKELLDNFYGQKYGWQVELMRAIQRFVGRRARAIIAPSFYLKGIIEKWGIAGEKIKVVYNTAKEIDFNLNKEEVRRELGLEGDIILSAGRLVPWKGFGALIELMPELLKINNNFKLIIAGDGLEKENLEVRIKKLELNYYIKLIGRLNQEELWKYMRASDIFALNTGYEGMPHIIIEAMQVGVPVVTTDSGGNRELVKNYKTGILVKYNNKEQIKNAIIKLWRDKQLAAGLAGNAKEEIKNKFSEEKTIKETLQILKSV